MAAKNSNLLALEGLMVEFFQPGTSNERKRQIEELLNSFSQQEDAWRHCLQFIDGTDNQSVMMYCFTVLERVINRQWAHLPEADQSVVRTAVINYLLHGYSKVPTFITNKLAKLLVDIGRFEWPKQYPDFYSNILKLIQDPDTVLVGLTLLETCSAEIAQPREDLQRAERREELKILLLQQVPLTLNILTNLLDSVLEKHRMLQAATPPSSPSRNHNHSNLMTSSPAYRGDLISNMFNTPDKKIIGDSLLPLDAESYKICLQTLRCVSELFSWIPLSDVITPTLLSTIFHFATFGCEASHKTVVTGASRSAMSGSSRGQGHHQSLGLLAMGCINELLSKNCVPADFENFLLQMFQQTFYLLQKLTRQSTSAVSSNRLRELEESFLEKFTEFLRLFVNNHLRRFEANEQFPVMDFLSLLFQYTFQQPSLDGFYACLDIWTIFLDYLATRLQDRTADASSLISKYRDGLISFTQELLKKMQFKFNQAELDSLDDETMTDDELTEWQTFLKCCNETLAKLAELLPMQVFKLTFGVFEENLEIYSGLKRYITATPGGHSLSIRQESDCCRLHCTLRDLSTCLQSLGRLGDMVTGEHFKERLQEASVLFDRLTQMTLFNAKMKLHELHTSVDTVLKSDFIEIYAQTLATLKAYIHWVSQYYLESHTTNGGNKLLSPEHIINIIAESTLCIFDAKTPAKITHSASHLLLSLFSSVRPHFLLNSAFTAQVYSGFSQQMARLYSNSAETYLLIVRALSNFLLLRWPGVSDEQQQWVHRSTVHRDFLATLCDQFLSLGAGINQLTPGSSLYNEAKPVIKKSLQCLNDLVESVAGEVKKTKDICYSSMERHIHCAFSLFPLYLGDPGILEDIVKFFYTLMKSLRIQMGIPFTEQIIRRFMELFTREKLTQMIGEHSRGSTGSASSELVVVEKFLAMLQLVVEEPGVSFKAFLPQIISICLDHMFPIVSESPAPDMKVPLYELLYTCLLLNWKYFFKVAVHINLGATQKNEKVLHQDQFIGIMQAFGVSFMQTDITVFRNNVDALEKLNVAWKLYEKAIFQEVLMPNFLTVLFQTLLAKSHDLLQEEMLVTIYNMAAVNFEDFYTKFLLRFLKDFDGIGDGQKTKLTQDVQIEKDLPSFVASIKRLVSDMRYYQLINSSLPPGAVSLMK